MVPLKKLDRYLLRYFFQALLVVMLAIGLTIIVVNMVEQIRDFVDHQVPLIKVVEYYVYFGAWVLKSFMPMFVLLATLFSVSILARRRELLAMKAAGISLYRIALPFLVAAAAISAAHFYYNEYIYPPVNRKRVEMKEFTIEARSRAAISKIRNVYRQIAPGTFYTISNFDVDRAWGRDLKLYVTSDNRLERIITAEDIRFEDFRWIAQLGQVRTFDSTDHESFVQFDTMSIAIIKDKPGDFAQRLEKPEDMGLEDLQNYIDLQKRTGGPYLRESIDMQIKYSFPLTSLIVVLICLPFAANPQRSGIAVSFAMGAGISLVYFVLFQILKSAGYNEKVPELVAVWGVNSFFLLAGIVLILGARK